MIYPLDTIGILAGKGEYPRILAERLAEQGHTVIVAGIQGECRGQIAPHAAMYREFPLGAIGALVDYFRRHGAQNAFFAGGVTRAGAMARIRPDRYCLSLLPVALFQGDDQFLRAVARLFSRLGVQIGDPFVFLTDLHAESGRMAGPPPNSNACKNLKTAWNAARQLGLQDKGQAAIAFGGKIVGVETRSGTDRLIATSPGPGAVLAKVVKQGQDRRFDMPVVGPSTALVGRAVGLRAIAVEAGGVLLLNKARLVQLCNRFGISLLGLPATGEFSVQPD